MPLGGARPRGSEATAAGRPRREPRSSEPNVMAGGVGWRVDILEHREADGRGGNKLLWPWPWAPWGEVSLVSLESLVDGVDARDKTKVNGLATPLALPQAERGTTRINSELVCDGRETNVVFVRSTTGRDMSAFPAAARGRGWTLCFAVGPVLYIE